MWIGSSNVAVTCSGCFGTTLPSAGYVDASAACANSAGCRAALPAGADVAARAGEAAATPSPVTARKPRDHHRGGELPVPTGANAHGHQETAHLPSTGRKQISWRVAESRVRSS